MKLVSRWLKGNQVILALIMVGIAILLAVSSGSAQEGSLEPSNEVYANDDSISGPAASDATAMVLLIQNEPPWPGNNAITDILKANNIAYDSTTSGDLGRTDLSPYFMIIVASSQPESFYVDWNKNLAKIEAYVTAGGRLWMSAATDDFKNQPVMPGGVGASFSTENFNDVPGVNHPWVSGVPNPIGSYSFTSHTLLKNLIPRTTTVALGQKSQIPTLIDYPYGYGRVFVSSMPLEFAYAGGWTFGPILPNSLLEMANGANLNIAGLSALPGNSYATYLGAAGDPVSWSLDVFTGGNDVVGSWNFLIDYGCNNTALSGGTGSFNANGTMGGYMNGIFWSQQGNRLILTDVSGIQVYLISYVAGDIMGGSVAWADGRIGCWEANRLPADELPSSQERFLDYAQGQSAPGDPNDSMAAQMPPMNIEPDVSAWLTVTPGSGSLVANSVAKLTITVDASAASTTDSGLVRIITTDPDRYRIYMPINLPKVTLPVLLKNYESPFAGPNELEPNDSPSEANGRLILGQDYFGSPDDDHPGEERDWFYIDYNGTGNIAVEVTNFLADAQVLLYKDPDYGAPLDVSANQPSGHYSLLYNGAAGAGKYMIWIFAPAGHPSGNGDYTLNVTVN